MSPYHHREAAVSPHDPPPAPEQPAHPVYEGAGAPPFPARESLSELQVAGIADFASPFAFGYFKDRDHVAGFRPHRFSKVPAVVPLAEQINGKWVTATPEWEVARLELVSLLLHAEPAVYVSDRLPQMDAVRGVPTRPLDEFEAEGLAALRKGEDLFVRDRRMVGAIRAARQCVSCHGGERGQLLGVFTYTLRPTR